MSHQLLRSVRVAAVLVALATGALLIPTSVAHAGGWVEGPTSDAIMCDVDGDGVASEYVAIGTSLALIRLIVDGQGVTHLIGSERFDNTEYYSEDADSSIFVTGRNHFAGTVDEDGPIDGIGMANLTIADADGIEIAAISGVARYIDGLLHPLRFAIDGPCGMPYEPAE